MAFQTVPGAAEVVLAYDQDGEATQNTFHFWNAGGWNPTNLGQMCDYMGTWWANQLAPHLNQTTQLVAVEGKGLEFLNDVTATSENGVGNTGEQLGEPEPNNVSFSCWRKSAFTGKSARGRIYIAGISKGDTFNNRIALARATAWITALNLLATGAGFPSGTDHVIVSRRSNNLPRPEGVTFSVVQYGYANLVLDSRRDRMP